MKTVAFGLVVWCVAHSLSAAEPSWTITYGGAKSAVIVKSGDQWTITAEGQRLSLSLTADGTMQLRRGDTLVASGKRNKTALDLTASTGSYLKLELSAAKTRIWLNSDAKAIECRLKEGQIRVSQADKELGRVKYYSDTKKAKAKTPSDEEVALLRDATGPGAFLMPFLLDGTVPSEKRMVLVLVLCALDR
jgi:hypothetical protein